MRKLEYLLKESENRIKNFESEILRLNDTLKKKLEELEFWKNKFQNYEFESNQKDEKIILLTNEIERL